MAASWLARLAAFMSSEAEYRCQPLTMEGQTFKSILSLVIKRKVVQNVNRMSENNISVCQYVRMSTCPYVNMSICQNATFQLRYQNESCSKCHQEKVVKKFEREREKE